MREQNIELFNFKTFSSLFKFIFNESQQKPNKKKKKNKNQRIFQTDRESIELFIRYDSRKYYYFMPHNKTFISKKTSKKKKYFFFRKYRHLHAYLHPYRQGVMSAHMSTQ